MQAILDFFTGTLNSVAWIWILLPCVAIGGVLFTVLNRGMQFTKLGYALKNTIGKAFSKKETAKGSISPFQAMTTALAGTVGTGNIVGTCQAIAMGGYGAIFWLIVAGLLGMIIKYSEVVLSVHYREKNENGEWVGGPMYYITKGLGKNWKWLAILFAGFAVLASFGIGNLSQANSISGSISNAIATFASGASEYTTVIGIVVGVVIAVLTAFVLFGGIKRIGSVTEKLVPFMCVLYIIFSLIVICFNVQYIGLAFVTIFKSAFTFKAVAGGSFGAVVIWGLRRSAFSNEAGLGSAGMAHATADTEGPVQQGLFGIFEVFADTIVVCTLTGLAVITPAVAGKITVVFGEKPGSELVTSAFATVFGPHFAAIFVAIALALFAYSTILGWSFYGTRCIEYLFGTKATKIYQAVFVLMTIVGSVASLGVVWDLADTFNGLMAIPNFIALFALSGVVAKLTRDHFSKDKLKIRDDKK